jgi:hypothetical protein
MKKLCATCFYAGLGTRYREGMASGANAAAAGERTPPPPPPPPTAKKSSSSVPDKAPALEPMDCSAGIGTDPGLMSNQEKAQAYINKKKIEAIAALREGLKDKVLVYDAIKKSRGSNERASYLKGGAPHSDLNDELAGTFFNTGDGRLMITGMDCRMQAKQAWTFSFDRATLRCTECDLHGERPFLRNKGDKSGGREVIILADQSFPPMLNCKDERRCIKICRLESGSLEDLAKEWLDMARNKEVARGTVVMLGSVSHMKRVGTVGYCEDYVEAARQIGLGHGGKVEVIPLPLLYLAGVECPLTIRVAAEVSSWCELNFKDEDWYLADSYRLAGSVLSCNDESDAQLDYSVMLALPGRAGPNGQPGKRMLLRSEGWQLPKRIKPASPAQEKELVLSVLSELRGRLALDLCPEPVLDRSFRLPRSAKQQTDFIVIGSSNAGKTGRGLNRQGFNTNICFSDMWRVTPTSVIQFQSKIKEVMSKTTTGALVMQMLDNSVFFGKKEDGTMLPALKGNDGIFHLEGDLVVAGKDRQMEILNMISPIMEMVREIPVVFITPMARYFKNGCCDEMPHISNRFQRSFREDINKQLAELARNVKNFMFMNNFRNVLVLEPAVDMRGLSDDEIWDSDPIHPRESFYDILARSIVVICGNRNKKRAAEDATPGEPEATRPLPRGGHSGGRGYTRGTGSSLPGGRGGNPPRGQRGARGHGGRPGTASGFSRGYYSQYRN